MKMAPHPPVLGAAIAGLILLAASCAHAGDLDGEWRQTSMRQTYRLAPSWNTDYCPPRPRDRSSSRPKVFRVTGDAGRYAFDGGRRSRFGSHRCLSPNPAVKLEGYAAGSRTTTCATPKSEGTREEGSHQLILRDDNHVEVRGKHHYYWVLQGNPCEAWMTEVRRFERVAPKEPPPPVATPEPAAPEPATEPSEPPPTAEPESAPPPVATAEERLRAGRRDRRRRPGIALDLRGDQGGGDGSATAGRAFELRRSGRAETGAGGALALLIGSLVLALALVIGLILYRRRAREAAREARPRMPEEVEVLALSSSADEGPASAVLPEDPGEPEAMRCPDCGRDFPVDARFCPFDSAPLDPAWPSREHAQEPATVKVCPLCERQFADLGLETCPDDYAALVTVIRQEPTAAEESPRPGSATGKHCPLCGAHYPDEITFCGKDGTLLMKNATGEMGPGGG